MINDEVGNLKVLKDIEITVVTITTEDVPSSTHLIRKSISNGEDILVEFNLPAKTKNIRIDVTAKLESMT